MEKKVLENSDRQVEENDSNGALTNQSNAGFTLGDVTWVKHRGSSWWPAQVVDENSVSSRNKPKRKRSDEVLVRLYGSYEYSFVDPATSLVGFDNVLKRHKGSHKDIIQEALKQGFKTKAKSGKAKGNEEEDVDDNSEQSDNDVTPHKAGESARKLKVMQVLGLIGPSDSPFLKSRRTLTLVQ